MPLRPSLAHMPTSTALARVQRLEDKHEAKRRIEERFLVLFAPLQKGLRQVVVDQDEGRVSTRSDDAAVREEDRPLSLVCVDEAHHLQEQGHLKQIVSDHASEPTRLIMLSDASQTGSNEMSSAFEAREVRLEKVVSSRLAAP